MFKDGLIALMEALNELLTSAEGICRPIVLRKITKCGIMADVNLRLAIQLQFEVESARPMELDIAYTFDIRSKRIVIQSRRQVTLFRDHLAPCVDKANAVSVDLHLCDCYPESAIEKKKPISTVSDSPLVKLTVLVAA